MSATIFQVNEQEIVDNLGRIGSYTGSLDESTRKPRGQGRMEYATTTTTTSCNDDESSSSTRTSMVYEGQWIDGDWSGFGKVIYQNEDSTASYEGTFLDNRKHGLGIMTYADGRIYDGCFQSDKRTGKGKMMYLDGSVYWGYWSASAEELPHGRGKLTLPDGTIYDGEFDTGKIEGHGRMTFPDGRWYLGEFSDGAQNGLGLEVRADGSIHHEGIFHNGTAVNSSSFPQQKCSSECKIVYRTRSYGNNRALVGPLPRRLNMKSIFARRH